MKVAHISPSFYPATSYGGPTESLYRLSQSLPAQGCDVRVLTTDANGPERLKGVDLDRETEIEPGLKVRYCRRLTSESVSPALLSELHAYLRWADVVHLTAVYSFPTMPTFFLTKLYRKPVVWSTRGALARWSGSRKPAAKAVWDALCLAASPSRLVLHATSEIEKERNLKRLPALRNVVIPNGVEPGDQPHEPRKKDRLRLLALGRLDPIKGLENLVLACSQLNGNLKNRWSLTIAGSGTPSYERVLRDRIRQLSLTDRISLVGRVEGDAKEDLYSQADILVAPSYLENFGMVIAEALAHGIPVIAGKGTPWQRLEEKQCGFWCDNDPSNLARAIERMESMPLQDMGERGRQWMKSEFNWSEVGRQMAELYRSMQANA